MAERGPLPFMKTIEDAMALVERHRDPFFVTAFMVEAWLGDVHLKVAAEYAEHKQAKDRSLQIGMAWRSFLEVFGRAGDDEFGHIFESLLRFSEHEDVQAELLRRAMVPVGLEHECFGDYVGPKSMGTARNPKAAVVLMKRTVERWCDWVEARVHFQTHFHYHVLPESFDPDPEKRELAALGTNQRVFPHLSAFNREWWEWHHREAAERFKDSPKWQTIGKTAAAPLRSAPSPVDEGIICLWPLVKRFNWTYRDLMRVAVVGMPSPWGYPLEREQDLAAYCVNVLGLRKPSGPKGRSSSDGRPRGYEVALRLFGH